MLPASRPGRLLEWRGDASPRGMTAHDRTRLIGRLRPLYVFSSRPPGRRLAAVGSDRQAVPACRLAHVGASDGATGTERANGVLPAINSLATDRQIVAARPTMANRRADLMLSDDSRTRWASKVFLLNQTI